MAHLFVFVLGLWAQGLDFTLGSSSGCRHLNMIASLSHLHFPHLMTLPPHIHGVPIVPVKPVGRRFLLHHSHHHGPLHINTTILNHLIEASVLNEINKTLPTSAEIEKSCRFDIDHASSTDINLLKQLYKLGMKLCTVCDHFDNGNGSCHTVGVCSQSAVCYRGYNNDYSSHNTATLAYLHPHAVYHGCCKPSTDKNCHYRYRYKVTDSKKHPKANYTVHTCNNDACNKDYVIYTKMRTFVDKIRAVDGRWSSWSHWSSCSQTCGTAHVTRHRSCTNPAPKYGGHTCSGSSTETKLVTCHTGHCPRNGSWGSWGSYTACSRSCGGGYRTRHRSCDHPSPAYGGSSCHGSSSYTETCNTNACPVNGNFTSWSSWSVCSVTCLTGVQSRSRSCTAPAPAHGGKPCNGNTKETRSCDMGACPVWSSWFYGQCSVTCGNGTTDRIRRCSSGHDEDCPGSALEHVGCNSGPCPVNGSWSSWGSWSVCSLTCAGGQMSRSRTCDNPAPQFNGADCQGNATETENCNTQPCPIWSAYYEVTSCSVTCGQGVIMLQRNCTYGTNVTDCVGSPFNERPCFNKPCF